MGVSPYLSTDQSPSHTNTPNNSHAPHARKGFYGGLVLSGAVFGVLLGAVVGTALHETVPPRALQRYGFRIPFLCGFLVALAGLGLHKYVPDVAEIEEDVGPGSPPTSPCARHEASVVSAAPSVSVTEAGSSGSEQGGPSSSQSTASGGSSSRVGVGGAGAGAATAAVGGGTVAAVVKPNPLKDLGAGHKLELALGTVVLFLYCTAFYECLVWLPVRARLGGRG